MSGNQNKYLQRTLKKELALRKELKPKLWEHQERKCAYCGKYISLEESTLDHIVPMSKGGDTTEENCVICCKKCNQEKGNQYLYQSFFVIRSFTQIKKLLPFIVSFSK